MLAERIEVDNIYMVLGYTGMRKSITGLTAIVKYQFKMNPFERSLFLFCGKRAVEHSIALAWRRCLDLHVGLSGVSALAPVGVTSLRRSARTPVKLRR